MNKNKFWYSSRFWVIIYAVVTLIIMSIQFILGLLKNENIHFYNIETLEKFINGDLNLPMTALSWCWTALISLYCGSDRVVDIAKTTKLSVGQTSMGDLAKLRGMIALSLVLFITAVVFNFMTDKEYTLSAYASAFGMTVISYVAGNKAVKATAYFGSHEDKNEDGVPDIAEAAYNKWKRQQIKNGVENIYLNFDYFLDDPANKEWEEKLRPDSVSTKIEEKKNEDSDYQPILYKKKGLLNKAEEVNGLAVQ